MKYLLDTNVLSDLRKQRHPPMNAWFAQLPMESAFISAVTAFEIEHGILRLARKDPLSAAPLRDWLDGAVLSAFSGRILPVDEAVALAAAPLHVPDPMPAQDAWIAATAQVHRLTLVTRNIKDFERTGTPLLDPWSLT